MSRAQTIAAGPAAPAARPLWLATAPFSFLLLWSLGFAIGRVGLDYTGPFTLLAWRYGLVLAVLVPLIAWFRPPLPRTVRAWIDLAVIGFLIQFLYFNLAYFAFRFGISVGTLSLIVSMQPIVVGLAAPALAGERVSGQRWLGLLLGLAGAGLVIASRSTIELTSPIAIGLTLAALLAMCSATLYEKRFGVAQHPLVANGVQYIVGFAFTLPLALMMEDGHVDWTLPLIGSLAYLVIGNSLVAISLLLAMIRAGEVSKVSALFFLVPPASALIAWPMLGEAMPALGWAGMAVAAGGVALVSASPGGWRRLRRRRA